MYVLRQSCLGMFTALLQARESYRQILTSGIQRDDRALAFDDAYNSLLAQGLSMSRLGGPEAVSFAAQALGTEVPGGDPAHFLRLWRGLLTDQGQIH